MNFWVFAALFVLVTFLVIVWWNRRNQKSNEEFEHKFITAVMHVCMNNEIVDMEQAETILSVWWGYREFLAGNFRKCACGSTNVHCEEDEEIINGMKHTMKFCDVADSDS